MRKNVVVEGRTSIFLTVVTLSRADFSNRHETTFLFKETQSLGAGYKSTC